jgi:hypothetical protein
MRQTILFIVFIISCIQLSFAQKIYLIYKVKTTDSLLIFQERAFSDKAIQNQARVIFQRNVTDKHIISIEDNLNRKFEKAEINHSIYYPKLLNEGYYKLYELNTKDTLRYIIYSKNDSLVLEKNDSVIQQCIKKDYKYIYKLINLSKDYPELNKKAQNINFNKKDFQNFISDLNGKNSDNNNIRHDKNRFDYLSFGLKGFVQKNRTDIMLDVSRSHYFIDISPNFSVRYGLRANYYTRTVFCPEEFTGFTSTDSKGKVDSLFYFRDHYETMTGKILEIPISVNYEITNSTITPFINVGLAPTIYSRKITRTDFNDISHTSVFTLNVFANAGIKLKLTNSFNIVSEINYETIKGLNFEFGIEYYFRLNNKMK